MIRKPKTTQLLLRYVLQTYWQFNMRYISISQQVIYSSEEKEQAKLFANPGLCALLHWLHHSGVSSQRHVAHPLRTSYNASPLTFDILISIDFSWSNLLPTSPLSYVNSTRYGIPLFGGSITHCLDLHTFIRIIPTSCLLADITRGGFTNGLHIENARQVLTGGIKKGCSNSFKKAQLVEIS